MKIRGNIGLRFRAVREKISAAKENENMHELFDGIIELATIRNKTRLPQIVDKAINDSFQEYHRQLLGRSRSNNPEDSFYQYITIIHPCEAVFNGLENMRLVLVELFKPIELNFFANPDYTSVLLQETMYLLGRPHQSESSLRFIDELDAKLDLTDKATLQQGLQDFMQRWKSVPQQKSFEYGYVDILLFKYFHLWNNANHNNFGVECFTRKFGDLVKTLHDNYPNETVRALEQLCDDNRSTLRPEVNKALQAIINPYLNRGSAKGVDSAVNYEL